MSEEIEQNQGLPEAHSRPENPALAVDPERAAKVGSTRAIAEAAMAGLAAKMAEGEPDAEQQSLLFDEDEAAAIFAGPVRHVANIRDAAKRARGRPPGSQNRRSTDLANYLLSMGYRDPALNLADLANADPLALALELAGIELDPMISPIEQVKAQLLAGVLKRDTVIDLMMKAESMIKDANAELLPYFHAKRPTTLNVDRRSLGLMLFGELPASEAASDGLTLHAVRSPAEKDQ